METLTIKMDMYCLLNAIRRKNCVDLHHYPSAITSMGWTRIAKYFIAISTRSAAIATWSRSQGTKRKYSYACSRTTPPLTCSSSSASQRSLRSRSWQDTITCLRISSRHFTSLTESYLLKATTTKSMRHHRLDSSPKAKKAQK